MNKTKIWDMRTTSMILLVVSLITAFLIIDFTTYFWLEHGFITAMTAGAVPIILTVLFVDRWLLAKTERQWSTVATVGFNGLGIYCSKYLEFLASAYIDHKDSENLNHWDISSESATSTWSLMKYAKWSQGRLLLTIFDGELLPGYKSHPFAHMPKSRMLLLMQDPAWCVWFEQRSYDFRMKHYETVARWTPIMMDSRKGREMLNYFAMLSHPMLLCNRKMKMIEHSKSVTDCEWLFDQLFLLDIRTRRLANELWKFGENPLELMLDTRIGEMSLSEEFDVENDELLISYC